MKLLNFKKLKNYYIIHEIEVTKMYLFKLNLFKSSLMCTVEKSIG